MCKISLACLLLCCTTFAFSQSGPEDPKAQKTYAEAQVLLKQHRFSWARDAFKKADQQDGGRCLICEDEVYELSIQTGDFKGAAESALQIISQLDTCSGVWRCIAKRQIITRRSSSPMPTRN